MSGESTQQTVAGLQKWSRMQRVSPLTIGAVFKQGSTVGQGYVLDLSRGGVFLTTNQDFAMGDEFRLRFFLPFQLGQVDADVVVRWRTQDAESPPDGLKDGLGLEFVRIDDEMRDKVERFLARFLELADMLGDE